MTVELTVNFGVPVHDVESGVYGHLNLNASISIIAPETAMYLETVMGDTKTVFDLVNQLYEDITARLGYRYQIRDVHTVSYTLQADDVGRLIRMHALSNNVVIIPLESVVSFPMGTIINVRQAGQGDTLIQAGDPGVIINSPDPTNMLDAQNLGCALIKVGADEWDMVKAFKGIPVGEIEVQLQEIETAFGMLESRIDQLETDVAALKLLAGG